MTCRSCRDALEAHGLGYPWPRPRASSASASIDPLDQANLIQPDLSEARIAQGPAGSFFEGMIFDSEFRVPYGQVVEITRLSRSDFYPAGILVDDARDWRVLNVKIEHHSQLLRPGVDAAEISSHPSAHMTRWRVCRMAQRICLMVRYAGDDTGGGRFLAAIVGTFADPKDPQRSVLWADPLARGDLRNAMRADPRIGAGVPY